MSVSNKLPLEVDQRRRLVGNAAAGDVEGGRGHGAGQVRGGEGEDHPRSLRDHVPRRRPCGQELRPHGGHDRPLEVFERHLGERRPLNVFVRDEVERDLDASGPLGHGVDLPVDCRLVEGIDPCRLGHSSRGADLLGHLLEVL
jgi:hypothetical protein